MAMGLIVKIRANLMWRTFRPEKEEDQWVADCPPLKLVVQGETLGELHEAIEDSLSLLFEELVDSGDLNQFMFQHGWEAVSPLPETPSSETKFDIPYEIKMGYSSDLKAIVC